MQESASPRTKPCDKRMPRCGQRSADAAVRPEPLRQSAIDPAGICAGITAPAGKSTQKATGVHEPVVSECMIELSEQNQIVVRLFRTARRATFPRRPSRLHKISALARMIK
jgi:hypothetical protein